MNTLITGCAGFIGFYLARELTKNKRYSVIGVDNLNNIDGYLKLKKKLSLIKMNIKFSKTNLEDKLKKINITQDINLFVNWYKKYVK